MKIVTSFALNADSTAPTSSNVVGKKSKHQLHYLQTVYVDDRSTDIARCSGTLAVRSKTEHELIKFFNQVRANCIRPKRRNSLTADEQHRNNSKGVILRTVMSSSPTSRLSNSKNIEVIHRNNIHITTSDTKRKFLLFLPSLLRLKSRNHYH